MKIRSTILILAALVMMVELIASSNTSRNLPDPYTTMVTYATDTIPLVEREGDFITDKTYNPFDLETKEVEQKVEYDPKTNQYVLYEKVGGQFVRTPTYLTFEEYLDYKAKEQEKRYFNTLAGIKSEKKSRLGRIDPMDKIDLGGTLVDRLFGGTEVNIQPQGTVDVSVGWLYSRFDNPSLPQRTQRQNRLDFPTPLIKMNVDGKIGKKLDLGFNYDTQSNFDFDRLVKLGFDSQSFSEDDIIKKIEAGNVSLPLRGNLIQGAQSLFGLKTELQFGRLRITALASQQKSKSNNLKIENGETIQDFVVNADEYDENRHFFLSQYNRNTYEKSLSNMPYINTSHQIAQIEVWISDDRVDYQENTAMIAAISDLGEPDVNKITGPTSSIKMNPIEVRDEKDILLPRNQANDIYDRILDKSDIEDIDKVSAILTGEFEMKRVRDFEVFRGRKLSPSEYTYHPKLGTISLNSRLRPNQVMGVAYNYYYTTICDSLFQVGMLSASALRPANQTDTTRVETPKVHFVKLIKSTNQVTRILNGDNKRVISPQWDLMMKNVYPLRANQLNPKDFVFDIYYEDDFDDGSIKKYLPQPGLRRVPLLQLFNLDRLNRFNDPQPDGYFDYVPGVTVIERSGSVILPILEPFGKHLSIENFQKIDDQASGSQRLIDSIYKFQMLYDTTISIARTLGVEKNKFTMRGRVKTSNDNGEYALGPFVPQGSVRVTAGGRTLIENQDYEIDYGAGRLRIINDAYLNGGTPINISFEDNSAFNFQQKNMLGLRAEYQFNKKSSLGFTYLKVYERPYTIKVNIEDDPIKNRMLGLDYNLDQNVPFLTKLVDKLPFYSTTEKSKINLSSEVALLLPDHANGINTTFEKSGLANIDDFEGAVNNFNLGGFAVNQWVLASTPENLATGEGKLNKDIKINANRARLNWYSLDFGINRSGADNDDPYTAPVPLEKFFPKRRAQPGQNITFTFDLSFYPEERGPYNFDNRDGNPPYSKGFRIKNDSLILNNPKERWGGIMRYFPNADFEAANYESIEFWMMNPFEQRRDGKHAPNEDGELVFNLGSVSEDIMKDNLLFFENAIPTTQRKVPVTNTPFGKATVSIPLVSGFDLQEGKAQDLGFDGINDADERKTNAQWLTDNGLNSIQQINQDPSNDNFVFFNDASFAQENNLLIKMKQFNSPQGNAPLNNGSSNNAQFVQGNNFPDSEDLNNNKTLDQTEAFYEYKLRIKANNNELDTLALGPYFRQSKDVVILTSTGPKSVKWYRIQIPIASGKAYNGIEGFRSIQFLRMYMTNFASAKTIRMLDFQMQRSQWRKLPNVCDAEDAVPSDIKFSIDDVGVEENGEKNPFNYKEPVLRTSIASSFGNFLQDEKSLVLKFTNLTPNCEVSVNKLSKYNLALYKRLQLYVHAEGNPLKEQIPDGDLSIFIRIGKDYINNYYEYELPLTMSKVKDGVSNPNNIWPHKNYINFSLDSLVDLKKLRIVSQGKTNVEVAAQIDPTKRDTIRLVGNPSLGLVKSIVIGVRNNKTGQTYDGEIWVNELRVTGFDESAAVAAQTKLQIQMADLAEINVGGAYNSVGFSSLQDRLHERLREEVLRYDVSGSIDAGKILPKALKLNMPIYAQYQKEIITPEYDPYDQDVKVKEKLAIIEDATRRQEVKEIAREESTIKTFNVTNFKTQAGNPKWPWAPSNVSATYAYTEAVRSDAILLEDKTTTRNLGLDYAYNLKTKYIEPLKFIKPKALKILSDFNFSPLPNTFTFTTRMVDLNNSRTFRLPTTPVFVFDDKRLNWERNYVVNWDLSRSLRLNFRANSTSIVDQIRQAGIADTSEGRDYYDQNGNKVTPSVNDDPSFIRDYRNANLRKLGRSKNYDHNIGLNYKVPFKNLPYMDWVVATVDYKADYAWDGGSLVRIDGRTQEDGSIGTPLGNVIKNGQNAGLNFTLNFDRLYNKVPYLKAIETGKAARAVKPKTNNAPRRKSNNEPFKSEEDMIRGDKQIDMVNSPDMDAGDGKSGSKKKDGKDAKDKKDAKKKEDQPRDPSLAERIVLRPLMLVRNIKADYKEEKSTIIPGFMSQSALFGLSEGFAEPGWQFAAGVQPRISGDNNWLVSNQDWFNDSPNFNQALSQAKRKKLELRTTIEPFKDFNIDVNMKRNYSETHTEVFRTKLKDNMATDQFAQMAQFDVGSFDATFYAINTLFRPSDNLYEIFKSNREVISRRLPNQANPGVHPSDPSYVEGYGPTSYSVNIPAFMAAYRGLSPYTIELDQKKDISRDNYIPKPNWQLSYNGLKNLKPFKKVFSNFAIKHGYNSTIRINDFRTDAQYNENRVFALSPNDNYFSRFEMSSVIIQEQFVPIIGISMKTNKDMKIDVEYKKSRTLDLGTTQLRETNNTEIAIGAGYVIKDFKMGKAKKKKPTKKKKEGDATTEDEDKKKNDSRFPALSLNKNKGVKKSRDLKFNVTYSLRDDLSVAYDLQTGVPGQSDRGARTVTLNPTIEYDLNSNLSLRFYLDYNKSTPKTSNTFPTTNVRSGITFRFNIQ